MARHTSNESLQEVAAGIEPSLWASRVVLVSLSRRPFTPQERTTVDTDLRQHARATGIRAVRIETQAPDEIEPEAFIAFDILSSSRDLGTALGRVIPEVYGSLAAAGVNPQDLELANVNLSPANTSQEATNTWQNQNREVVADIARTVSSATKLAYEGQTLPV